jgi:acetyltransferase-like isoleucine patch superfamily enzyme
MPFYTETNLASLGLKSIGKNCQVDESVIFISPSLIELGDEVRIDAYSLLNAGGGWIHLADKVHIASHVRLIGGGGISFGYGSGASSGVSVYSKSDNFSSGALAHPAFEESLRDIYQAPIQIGAFCAIGSNSVMLPGARMSTGSTLGAISLLKNSIPAFEIFGGSPAVKIGVRNRIALGNNLKRLGLELDNFL